MSEEDQDQATVRMVREHADRKRKIAVMEAELATYCSAFKALADGLSHNVGADFNLSVVKKMVGQAPLAKFDLSLLLAFLEQYTELRRAQIEGQAKLKELGL